MDLAKVDVRKNNVAGEVGKGFFEGDRTVLVNRGGERGGAVRVNRGNFVRAEEARSKGGDIIANSAAKATRTGSRYHLQLADLA
jgi:hypothetical protein